MYIVCLIIFEEKAEVQDQYLSLNQVQKAKDPIQDRNRSIGHCRLLIFQTTAISNMRFQSFDVIQSRLRISCFQ